MTSNRQAAGDRGSPHDRTDPDDPRAPHVRLGVSTCLLGHSVRMDGGHKRDRFLVEELGRYVTWIPVCPEVELGLGTPRPALRLTRDETGDVRFVERESKRDLTEAMRPWSEARLDDLEAEDLDGYVLKKDSPSCGLFRVKVHTERGMTTRDGRGLWAEALSRRMPALPIEEEGRLNDPLLRENFVLRVFTHARWRRLLREDPTPAGLVRFHTAHKLLLLAHRPHVYRALGRLVARAGVEPLEPLLSRYASTVMETLARPASRGRNLNVLQHLAGFVKQELSRDDKVELGEVLASYRSGTVPLVVPLTLLRHLLRRHAGSPWAEEQIYLDPYPADLMLRTRV